MVTVVSVLVEQWPVACVLYLPQTDLGWNKLTKVETNWLGLETNCPKDQNDLQQIFKSDSFFVFHSSRSSDDLLDIDFSQSSFPSLNSESASAGSQRNSLQLSSSDAASSIDAELKSQSTTDLRLTSASLPTSSPGI